MTCMCMRRTAKPGGLLRYGIPDFKMEKHFTSTAASGRWKAEGVTFHYNAECRRQCRISPSSSPNMTRSILAGGSEKPRDLQHSGP